MLGYWGESVEEGRRTPTAAPMSGSQPVCLILLARFFSLCFSMDSCCLNCMAIEDYEQQMCWRLGIELQSLSYSTLWRAEERETVATLAPRGLHRGQRETGDTIRASRGLTSRYRSTQSAWSEDSRGTEKQQGVSLCGVVSRTRVNMTQSPRAWRL